MSNLNLSPVAQFIQSNFNKQTATQYKSNIDAGFAALSIISQQFAPHQTGTYIQSFGTGTGGTGTYTVNLSQTVGSSAGAFAASSSVLYVRSFDANSPLCRRSAIRLPPSSRNTSDVSASTCTCA